MTVGEALRHANEVLKMVPDRDVDSAWIVCFVANVTRSELHFCTDKVLNVQQESKLEEMLLRRANREPLQHIFGFVPFYNVELKCDSRALIPRDETACIAEDTINFIKDKNYKTVLDIGTGSGAIAITVAKNTDARVTAIDISEKAISLAEENAKINGTEIEFIKSDLFEKMQGRSFDVIISNPPYIPSADIEKLERELAFEPQNALDGGADGLDFYRDIIAEAGEHLNKNGLLIFEIGFDQAAAVSAIMAKNGFINAQVKKDYSNLDREVYCFNEEK